jgi:hypothetical protein
MLEGNDTNLQCQAQNAGAHLFYELLAVATLPGLLVSCSAQSAKVQKVPSTPRTVLHDYPLGQGDNRVFSNGAGNPDAHPLRIVQRVAKNAESPA